MTISSDLDTWTADLATKTGLPVYRDPDKVLPPCIYIGFPDAATVTIGETIALDFPCYLVAAGHAGKTAGDWLLDNLVGWLTALARTDATPESVTVDGIELPSYRTTVRLHITPAAPPPPTPPQAEQTLHVDLYSGSFIRVMSNAVLDDGQPHWVMFDLATTPGPNGALISANGIASHDGVAWFDHGGQLGHVIHAGTDLPNITLSNYIRQGRLAQVHVDTTDPAHPALIITDVYNPPTP